MHTNAGYYGETGRVGHLDICINGGRRFEIFSTRVIEQINRINFLSFISPPTHRQPYCVNTTNANLCSHIWAICYMAQSLFRNNEIIAEPCLRKCPSGVNLNQPTRGQLQRRIGKSYRYRYGYALNYGIPIGQSTPKT